MKNRFLLTVLILPLCAVVLASPKAPPANPVRLLYTPVLPVGQQASFPAYLEGIAETGPEGPPPDYKVEAILPHSEEPYAIATVHTQSHNQKPGAASSAKNDSTVYLTAGSTFSGVGFHVSGVLLVTVEDKADIGEGVCQSHGGLSTQTEIDASTTTAVENVTVGAEGVVSNDTWVHINSYFDDRDQIVGSGYWASFGGGGGTWELLYKDPQDGPQSLGISGSFGSALPQEQDQLVFLPAGNYIIQVTFSAEVSSLVLATCADLHSSAHGKRGISFKVFLEPAN